MICPRGQSEKKTSSIKVLRLIELVWAYIAKPLADRDLNLHNYN